VIQEAYVHGISTRSVDELVQAVNSDGRKRCRASRSARARRRHFLRSVARRGLRSVRLVISDAHEG